MELPRLTQKILNSESPGVRTATLVDARHVVDGNDIVSLVVYDKSPMVLGGGLQYERRWVVVVSLRGDTDTTSWSKTRGIVNSHWEVSSDGG